MLAIEAIAALHDGLLQHLIQPIPTYLDIHLFTYYNA